MEYEKWLGTLNHRDRTLNENFISTHRFRVCKMAYTLGNILFMTKVEVVALMHPLLPILFLILISTGLFACATILPLWVMNNMWPFVVASLLIGAIDGSIFTSFMFLAVAKTDLPCDMKLHFRERELVVNLLLGAVYVGRFFAFIASFAFFVYFEETLLYQYPK